jgi:exopolysaccharide biosynthesis protein
MGKYRDFHESTDSGSTLCAEDNTTRRHFGTTRTIQHFCTGFGWIVHDGMSIANNSHNPTGANRAPRTAIGLDYDSNLILMVVDGCELCMRRRGPTLEELASLFIQMGARYAINMDGGGSTTMVHQMKSTLNRPSCLDIPSVKCQRKVATVHCVSSVFSDR